MYNCVSCHTLLGNGGYVGGDLTRTMSRRSPDDLIDFFNNPPILPPHREETHVYLAQEETEALIAYFEYLGTLPTLGWPPEPKKIEGGDIH